MKKILYLLFFLILIYPCRGQILINEIQVSNISAGLDPDGNYLEWIEILNTGDASIDLSDYYLTDLLDHPFCYKVGNIQIGPKSATQIWLSKDEELYSCLLDLKMDGGIIALYTGGGQLVDSITYHQQYTDISYGRNPIPNTGWSYFGEPTPGNSNSDAGIRVPVFSAEVDFSVEGGFYQGSLDVILSAVYEIGTLRYTLDGSWPTATSTEYTQPIHLSETFVIRARVFESQKLPGKVITHTYFLNESGSYPVISIATDPENFFSAESGIYVEGENGILGYCSEVPKNWNNDWERPINFEYFTPEGTQEINQLAGTKIAGNCSRRRVVKSLSIYARKRYGNNRLKYPFFQTKSVDECKSIVLRNSGSDAYFSYLRDGFMQTLLIGKMDIDYQAYEPATIFLNGEYWGILNMREKVNEYYPASNYNLDADQIDMLERDFYFIRQEVISGSGEHFVNLIDFILENDLSLETNYSHIKTQIDINELLNYLVAQIYFENNDWPNNNLKYWRPHVEGGKWRWVLFDTDFGWGLYPRPGNKIELAATQSAKFSKLFNALLKNDEFKNEFIQRMAGHINTTFDPARVTAVFDSIKGHLEIELPRHMSRWNRPSEYDYGRHIDIIMPSFTINQPGIVRQQVMDMFGISGMYTLNTDVNDPSMGYIQACEVDLPQEFSGLYFDNIPLRLIAVPCSGYIFSHWEGASSSEEGTIMFQNSADATITAVFESDSPASNIFINEVCASNSSLFADDYGQKDDWIEIYNDNEFNVNLAGWYLSDSVGFAEKYRIPEGHQELTTIKAKDYLIFWCDNNDNQGPLHTNFKLSREGEALSLVQKIADELHVASAISYPSLDADLTYGRIPGSGEWEYMAPTPNSINLHNELEGLFINEFLSRNCGSVLDEYGEPDDWIELYNPTTDTIDIGGLFLTDTLNDPLKYMIQVGSGLTRIPPNGFILLWADNQPEQGPLHLGFRLDSKSEQIGIYHLGDGFLDSLTYKHDVGELARGRYPDGASDFQLVDASPGDANRIFSHEKLYINEFVASSRSTLQDEYDEYDDWIELYNDNDFDVDIGGMFITDSIADPMKHRIPLCYSEYTTIPAKGYLILWADNEEEQGVLHLGFRLKASGEQIGLLEPDGVQFIDSLSYTLSFQDHAIGRLPDGSSNLLYLFPTPGSANELKTFDNIHINEFMANNRFTIPDSYGEYDDWIELYNQNDYPVNIGGMFITDTLDQPIKYRIPSYEPDSTTIPAKGFLVLWADNQPGQGILHLDFGLKSAGEQIGIVQPDGRSYIDSLSYSGMYLDQAFGLLGDGMGDYQIVTPSPGAPNFVRPTDRLFISEIVASGNEINPDDSGEYNDWIEVYNDNDFEINIGGFFISDSIDYPYKYRIPSGSPNSTTIGPKGYLILWADGQPEQGVNHLGFRLNGSGEQLAIVNTDGTEFIDSVTFPNQYKNFSYSRLNNTGEWKFNRPTHSSFNVFPVFSGLFINEVMGFNKTIIGDENREYDDWIELYNASNTSIDIGGLYMTNNLSDPSYHRIPSECPDSTTIPPGGYKVLWADNSTKQGIFHLGFRISKTGETIGLFNYSGELIDSMTYPFISPNISWGRSSDGDASWTIFYTPTPMMSNISTDIVEDFQMNKSLEIYPNPATDNVIFEISLEEPGKVTVEIIDGKGSVVSMFEENHNIPGVIRISWNCTNMYGERLADGLYFCRIHTRNSLLTGKMIIQ